MSIEFGGKRGDRCVGEEGRGWRPVFGFTGEYLDERSECGVADEAGRWEKSALSRRVRSVANRRVIGRDVNESGGLLRSGKIQRVERGF